MFRGNEDRERSGLRRLPNGLSCLRLQLLGDLFQTIRARAFDEYEPVTDRMLVQISGERFRVGKSPVTASPGRFGEMSADQIGFLDPALLESLDDGPVLDGGIGTQLAHVAQYDRFGARITSRRKLSSAACMLEGLAL